MQTLKIDLSIPLDIQNCEDKIENTVNYDSLCQTITNFIESNSFALIETVAEQTAALIKESFHVKNLSISVSKPNAIKNAKNIKITIDR